MQLNPTIAFMSLNTMWYHQIHHMAIIKSYSSPALISEPKMRVQLKNVPDWSFKFHAFFTISNKITTRIWLASYVSMLRVTNPRLFFSITSIFNYRFSHNMSEWKAHFQTFFFFYSPVKKVQLPLHAWKVLFI